MLLSTKPTFYPLSWTEFRQDGNFQYCYSYMWSFLPIDLFLFELWATDFQTLHGTNSFWLTQFEQELLPFCWHVGGLHAQIFLLISQIHLVILTFDCRKRWFWTILISFSLVSLLYLVRIINYDDWHISCSSSHMNSEFLLINLSFSPGEQYRLFGSFNVWRGQGDRPVVYLLIKKCWYMAFEN